MNQTFMVNINYDSAYKALYDFVEKRQWECTRTTLLRIDQRANIGDVVYFRCLHYWYKGIIAKGVVDELVEDNCVDVKFIVAINPKEQPILSIAELEKVLPNKNWKDRCDYITLDIDEAQILDDTWKLFMKTNNNDEA